MGAWAAPFVDGSIGSLAVASCLAAWAGKAYHVVDDHQAWAFARKACPWNDSFSNGDVAASASMFGRHGPQEGER